MTLAIPALAGQIILSIEYDPTGLVWCRLYDNEAIGWLVDEGAASPAARSAAEYDRLIAKPRLEPAEQARLVELAEIRLTQAPTTVDGRAPPSVTGAHQPMPIIIGSLAKPAPDTSPVVSPQWCQFTDPAVFIPDLTRMRLGDFLTALASNNGAHRRLQQRFAVAGGLLSGFSKWAMDNPALVFEGDL